MDKGLSDRWQGGLEAREQSLGLKMSDLLELPEPLGGVLNWMMRQETVTLAEVMAFLRQEEKQTHALLADLCDMGFVREIKMRGVTQYRVRLAAKRGRALPSSLWQALDEKVEQEGEERR